MKTPRELLLERHRSAEPKLDAIRQKALANRDQASAQEALPEHNWSMVAVSIRQVLRQFRWHLAGLSAGWLLIALLNIDPSPASATTIAKENIPSPRQLLASLRENRRQLLELMEPAVADPAPAAHPLAPPRRSELQTSNALA